MPTFNYGYVGWPFLTLFIGVIFILFDTEFDSWESKFGLGISITSLVVFIILLPFFSSPLFFASKYRDMLGTVEEKTFSNDISPIDPSRMVIIDYDVAAKLGDKRLVSDDMTLGSQTNIGKYTHQKIKDDLYYVAPINHSGYWKWRKNKKGTPGYIIVNAHNQKDVRLVKEINGKPIKLKYQEGGCFSNYLPRHIYQNGYKHLGIYEIEFELDDNFNPYYVVPMYDKKIGYGGKEIVKVLLVNPETGKIDEYKIENVPEWVDRVYPKDLINKQFNNWGNLVHGVFNWSNKDKMQLSQGTQLVYGTDGKCYLFSGVTSVGGDDASVGFILANCRTKQTTFYYSSGAIESAAQSSAQGKVQEKGYIASWPRPYNINGVWTYVMALKDNEGLIKNIGLVSYANYEVVGIGDNIQDAIRNYKAALNSKGGIIAPSEENNKESFVGKVHRIGNDMKDGQLYYYIILLEKTDVLFVGTSVLSNELPVTCKGDNVKLTYTSGSEGEIFIESFDNLYLNFKTTQKQFEVDSLSNVVSTRINKENLDNRVKTKLENMSDEEKEKMLE
jgi:hypothetical protein